jgi:cell division protein FtsL
MKKLLKYFSFNADYLKSANAIMFFAVAFLICFNIIIIYTKHSIFMLNRKINQLNHQIEDSLTKKHSTEVKLRQEKEKFIYEHILNKKY